MHPNEVPQQFAQPFWDCCWTLTLPVLQARSVADVLTKWDLMFSFCNFPVMQWKMNRIAGKKASWSRFSVTNCCVTSVESPSPMHCFLLWKIRETEKCHSSYLIKIANSEAKPISCKILYIQMCELIPEATLRWNFSISDVMMLESQKIAFLWSLSA